MENATSANLHINRDGHLGTMGLTGDKKAAVVRAGKWQRLVVAVELEKQKFCAYVNGKPAIEIVKNDKLVSNGRFALDTEFYLFSGTSCRCVSTTTRAHRTHCSLNRYCGAQTRTSSSARRLKSAPSSCADLPWQKMLFAL